MRFLLAMTSDEYKPIAFDFARSMEGNCTQIIRIERIQNATSYRQYSACRRDFNRRLNIDTEKRLYYGCAEQAIDSIINGKYDVDVYCSSNATYSNEYTEENTNRERSMFVLRVLLGRSANGDPSMRTPPKGYDSTTDGNDIFVIHDHAEILPEYLITYR